MVLIFLAYYHLEIHATYKHNTCMHTQKINNQRSDTLDDIKTLDFLVVLFSSCSVYFSSAFNLLFLLLNFNIHLFVATLLFFVATLPFFFGFIFCHSFISLLLLYFVVATLFFVTTLFFCCCLSSKRSIKQ